MIATVFVTVLSLLNLVNLNTTKPPITSSDANGVVSSFISTSQNTSTFPDRTLQAKQAQANDAHRAAVAIEAQRQALIAEQAKKAVEQAPVASQSVPVDNSDAKMFIYLKESGNRTTARNAGGCLGLGQACPGSKLLAVCPDLNDYACQDTFFTKYAISRYGSWEGAKAFWLSHHWW